MLSMVIVIMIVEPQSSGKIPAMLFLVGFATIM